MRLVSSRFRTKLLTFAILSTSIGAFSTPATAQPPPARPAAAPPSDVDRGKPVRDGRDAERGALREKIQQKVQTWLTVELSSRVGLDEKKSLRLSEAIKTHMAQRRTQREKLKAEADKLRTLVDSKAPDAQVRAQLDAVLGLAGRDEEVERFVKETGAFLSATEQAKLALAMPEVMRELKKMVREARGERRGGHRGGREDRDGRDGRDGPGGRGGHRGDHDDDDDE